MSRALRRVAYLVEGVELALAHLWRRLQGIAWMALLLTIILAASVAIAATIYSTIPAGW